MTALSPSAAIPNSPRPSVPNRFSFLAYAAKVAVFRARRVAIDVVSGPRRLSQAAAGLTEIIAESRTPLWTDEAVAERALQQGKVRNLTLACRAIDGLTIPAGAVFSFWRHVGPPLAARGFVQGRALQLGCMVPATGGGLCQLSNALYDVALQAGCDIVERHAHSRLVPGSPTASGRDATVAWNYVDLRFAPTSDVSVVARMDDDELTVRLMARPGAVIVARQPDGAPPPASAQSCGSCTETECFLHEHGVRTRHS